MADSLVVNSKLKEAVKGLDLRMDSSLGEAVTRLPSGADSSRVPAVPGARECHPPSSWTTRSGR